MAEYNVEENLLEKSRMPNATASLVCYLLGCLLGMTIAGCAGKEPAAVLTGEHLYVDAERQFVIEHPANWSRIRNGGEETTVRWRAPGGRSRKPPAEAVVVSLPPTQAIGGKARLAEDYIAARPQIQLSEMADRELPAALARQVRGRSPERRFVLFFLTTRSRAFILEFSAPSADFDRYLPLFEAMAKSFQTLD